MSLKKIPLPGLAYLLTLTSSILHMPCGRKRTVSSNVSPIMVISSSDSSHAPWGTRHKPQMSTMLSSFDASVLISMTEVMFCPMHYWQHPTVDKALSDLIS